MPYDQHTIHQALTLTVPEPADFLAPNDDIPSAGTMLYAMLDMFF